jgi:aminopeptidase
MLDPRLKQLGDTLIHYSVSVQPGDKVLIEATKNCGEFIKYLIKEIYKIGATPFVILRESDIRREIILGGSPEQYDLMAESQSVLMREMDARIEITEYDNFYEMNDVPIEKRQLFQKNFFQKVYSNGIKKWVTVGYPTKTMAQRFGMSTEQFENFYFSVVNANYQELSEKMQPLKEYLDKGQNVQIKAPNTDLSFDIKECKAFVCDGRINMPDGEVFIAPDKFSANGTVTFNADALYQGYNFSNIALTFKDGKVIKATSDQNEDVLNRILTTDEGSSYIGEFAIGTNPNIDRVIRNILYDEKILGSFHIAVGRAHFQSDNGQKSAVHWDMVSRMEKEYGGGEIIIDDNLILKDGIFIPKDLQPLNRSYVLKK